MMMTLIMLIIPNIQGKTFVTGRTEAKILPNLDTGHSNTGRREQADREAEKSAESITPAGLKYYNVYSRLFNRKK